MAYISSNSKSIFKKIDMHTVEGWKFDLTCLKLEVTQDHPVLSAFELPPRI